MAQLLVEPMVAPALFPLWSDLLNTRCKISTQLSKGISAAI